MITKLKITEQEASPEVVRIFCRKIIKLCCKNGLMDEVITALDDCGLKYEVEEE